MSDSEIAEEQLSNGNKGARAYFEKRVDMMLRSERDARKLFEFLKAYWPKYKDGGRSRPTDTGSVT